MAEKMAAAGLNLPASGELCAQNNVLGIRKTLELVYCSFKSICLMFRMLINRITKAKAKQEATANAKQIFQLGEMRRDAQYISTVPMTNTNKENMKR